MKMDQGLTWAVGIVTVVLFWIILNVSWHYKASRVIGLQQHNAQSSPNLPVDAYSCPRRPHITVIIVKAEFILAKVVSRPHFSQLLLCLLQLLSSEC